MVHLDYRRRLELAGVDSETLIVNRKGALSGETLAEAEPELTGLPTFVLGRADETPPAVPDLELERTLGSGGMAIVWAAKQCSLRRRVAVKELRHDRRTESARRALLREARVAGALEHPNIVPLHALGVTDDGWPVLVMKHIEGTPWSEALSPLYVDGTAAKPEQIERHLRILIHVCRATHFANERGVVHRDLKPANVMLGPLGEVYVLDWGLAVELGDPHIAAQGVQAIAGTPGYMAPEMAALEDGGIDRRTDVYLLGAVLHEIITGRKRHAGDTAVEQLSHAYHSVPATYERWVPEELARIANTATARAAEDRYQTAEALSLAIEAFLRHRSSRSLASEADDRLAQLQDHASRQRDVEPAVWSQLATEARFGYQQALREWPDNPDAVAGLQQLRTELVEYELHHENVRAAAALIDETEEPDPKLKVRLRALESTLAVRRKDADDFAQLRFDGNFNRNASTRHTLLLLNAVVLAGGAGVLFTLRVLGIYVAGFPAVIGLTVLLCVVAGLSTRRARLSPDPEISARMLNGVFITCLAVLVEFNFAWFAGLDLVQAEAMAMLVGAAGAAVLASSVDRRIGWSGLVLLLTGIAIVGIPAYRGLWIVLGGGVA
ncbi:MAG: serine/threonine protein kinase, partial [Nannocystaceae bacterium]|nr:serine/threonine protein kinase [Nannocystaceae bacterium]